MRLTIIPEDQTIIKDGAALQCSFAAESDIHAIQWYGERGVIEYKGGAKPFDDPAVIQPYVDAYAEEVARRNAPPPPPTPEQTRKALTEAVQKRLDAEAGSRGYDGILSLASYAASTHPPFAAEGRAGADWRDAVWGHCYLVLADVQAGRRAIPSEAELLAELPPMVWP